MSLVSMVFGSNFVSVVSDGLATDGEGNVVSANFKKFKVYNDKFIMTISGSSAVFDHIFEDVERALQHFDADYVMKKMANEISNADMTISPYMTVMMLNLANDGFYGIIQKAGEPVSTVVKPYERQYIYWISSPIGSDSQSVGNKLNEFINKAKEIDLKSIRKAQIQLNNYIAAQYPDSVNRNVSQYQFII